MRPVVERPASHLKRAFPGESSISALNLWRMRQLHRKCKSPTFSHSLCEKWRLVRSQANA